jgi:hypothetical protein
VHAFVRPAFKSPTRFNPTLSLCPPRPPTTSSRLFHRSCCSVFSSIAVVFLLHSLASGKRQQASRSITGCCRLFNHLSRFVLVRITAARLHCKSIRAGGKARAYGREKNKRQHHTRTEMKKRHKARRINWHPDQSSSTAPSQGSNASHQRGRVAPS